MEQLKICNDMFEIISGSSSYVSRPYLEAKAIGDTNEDSLKEIKKFIISIENIANKNGVKDERISSTKGKISDFSGYEDIKYSLDFLKNNLGAVSSVNDLNAIKDCLEKYQSLYSEGYNKNIRLVMLEYESALYSLVTGLSYLIANNIDVNASGYQIKISKKSGNSAGVVTKLNSDLAKQLTDKNHKEYLDTLIKGKDYVGVNTEIKESTFTESAVSDAIDLFDAITANIGRIARFGKRALIGFKNSIFGIVPIMRSIVYMKYKKKADTIQSLEQQADFIRKNIEQLQNIKTMDPKKKDTIVKKQQAVIDRYKKKSEKLRAQLVETEKEVASSVSKNNNDIRTGNISVSSNKDEDDDLVLESANDYETDFNYVIEECTKVDANEDSVFSLN